MSARGMKNLIILIACKKCNDYAMHGGGGPEKKIVSFCFTGEQFSTFKLNTGCKFFTCLKYTLPNPCYNFFALYNPRMR